MNKISMNSFLKTTLGIILFFTVSIANAVNYYSKSTGNLNATGTWGQNTDGTGTAPANFTTAGNVFYIRNNAAPTVNNNWTVSGAGSKIVLGNGTVAVNFTVGSNYVVNATMDIAAQGTLILTTTGTTAITFGTLDANSTVNFAEAGNQPVLAGSYGNLILSGSGTKTFPGSAVTVSNNLSIASGVVASLGTVTTHTTGTLTLNGNGQNSGTWGSTASTATYKNSTYFGTTGVGRLTVSTTSCSAGYWTGATSTDWNTASNWCNNTLPTSATDVVIPAGTTVVVTADAIAKSVDVSGALSMNDAVKLTVLNDFTVNSGGSMTMPGGNAVATLLVYNNFTNNGSTDFWKSNVVIGGNLISPSSSALQNQGNVIVGGDIIGAFNLTGGNGSNQIYAVNPNATVTITPASVDGNVAPGTYPSTESAALQNLVNTVIYGGSCPFTVNNISNVNGCIGSSASFTVTSSGTTSPTYQWQVNTGNGWSDVSNGSTYSGVTTSSLTINTVSAGLNNYQYRAQITSASCTKSGNPGLLSVYPGSSWIGVTSTDWNTASNWCGGIPTATSDITINSGTTFAPTIAAGTTALCRNLNY